MKVEFTRNIKLDIHNLIEKLLTSKEFKKEDPPSYGGQIYNSAMINRTFIKQIDSKTLEFSENGGYGGFLEVIATCRLQRIDEKTSKMILEFKYGNLEANILKSILIGLVIITGLTIILEPVIGFLFLFLSIIVFTVDFGKRVIVNQFKKLISSSLGLENKWLK